MASALADHDAMPASSGRTRVLVGVAAFVIVWPPPRLAAPLAMSMMPPLVKAGTLVCPAET